MALPNSRHAAFMLRRHRAGPYSWRPGKKGERTRAAPNGHVTVSIRRICSRRDDVGHARRRADRPAAAALARSRARHVACPPLQPTHRGGLRRVDPALNPGWTASYAPSVRYACLSSLRATRSARSWLGWTGHRASWRACFMAPAYAYSSAAASASRTSTWRRTRSPSVAGRGTRTASPYSPRWSSRLSPNTWPTSTASTKTIWPLAAAGRAAARPSSQVSERGARLGVAMGLPRHAGVSRSRHRPGPATPSP